MISHFRKMYDVIEVDSDGVQTLMDTILYARNNRYGKAIDMPFEEI